ncbi:MAG TPA: tryptophan synthase subunit alpha [Acidimicrobiales bacterium]|nr:tryptophan synthase subunit alpha [Acidimicrobiales bacterium]
MKSLEVSLRHVRDDGRKALVPYFVAGATPDWTRHVEAAVLGGADAIEIGVPFSDPMMDGVVIQEGALRALERGTTLESICQELESLDTEIPLVAMTYYNIFLHYGLNRAAGRLTDAGVSGAIVPDLSLEESTEWRGACDEHDVATVFLAAPSTPPSRLRNVAQRSQGFIYAAARMAVTGVASDAGEGDRVVASLREVTDVPVYVGIGISTPAQAASAATFSDGVIVGSALVKIVLDGATPADVEAFVRSFREAID